MSIPRSARFPLCRALGLAFAVAALATAASAQSQESFRLVPVTPTSLEIVLGDRQTFEVRVLDPRGLPVPGVPLTWEILSAPGSPRGTAGQPVPSDAAGVARATFGFGVAGNVTIRASFRGTAPVVFTVRVGSLGNLTPGRNTLASAGEAFDRICFNVFNTDGGTPRPAPTPTPLCVFMTGVLTNRDQRAETLAEMSPTGLGSVTKTAAAGAVEQQAIVASRLGALRGGALAAGNQISWTAGGTTIDGDLLASASSELDRRERLGHRVDAALAARAGRGGGRQGSAPVADLAPERDRRWGLFFTGRLQRGEQSGDSGDETAFDFDTTSGTLGVDFAAGANGFLGVAGGYATNQTDLSGGGGELEFDAQSLTLYGAWQSQGGSYVQGTVAFGQAEYDQLRRIELPVIGDLDARAQFDGDQQSASLEWGWTWGGRRVVASSFLRGSWARSEVEEFAEEGAVANVLIGGVPVLTDFGVALEAQELTSLLGELGFDLSGNISTSSGVLVPQLTVTYRHEFDNDARAVRASFLGDLAAGSSFFVFLDPPDRDWIDVGVSLSAQYLWGSLFVAYDQELGRDDIELSTLQAGLRFEF